MYVPAAEVTPAGDGGGYRHRGQAVTRLTPELIGVLAFAGIILRIRRF